MSQLDSTRSSYTCRDRLNATIHYNYTMHHSYRSTPIARHSDGEHYIYSATQPLAEELNGSPLLSLQAEGVPTWRRRSEELTALRTQTKCGAELHSQLSALAYFGFFWFAFPCRRIQYGRNVYHTGKLYLYCID
jgi:hypothetical protein